MLVAVAVSGGLDSLCALILLKRHGYDVFAIHGVFSGQPALRDPAKADLEEACRKLGVELLFYDLEKKFQSRVIEPFINDLALARTPNPCAICNRFIKFGALMAAARSLGADAMATGHYASLVKNPYSLIPRRLVARSADSRKDQSYFLALITTCALSRALFPLAELHKSQCREIVAQAGLKIPLPSESHDICFIDSTIAAFLKNAAPDKFNAQPGPIFLRDGNGELTRLGSHMGLWNYTEGQRRGLNLPYKTPLHVLEKDRRNNALIVGPRDLLETRECVAGSLNFHVEPRYWPPAIFVKLRFSHQARPAAVEINGDRAFVRLAEPAFPTAPGQIAAFYDEDGRLLGGGIVDQTGDNEEKFS